MNNAAISAKNITLLPMAQKVPEGAGEFHLPSHRQPFVTGSHATAVGNVPLVTAELKLRDKLGHCLVRWNIGRDSFTVEAGLYAIGSPTDTSPVLVTANYKMSFDLLRRALNKRDTWILVLDTKGVNVWCAAGKGTFGTEELVDRIGASRLHEVVSHRKLILPQLGATGVAAFEIQRYSGFSVVYGPVMVDDLPEFLDNSCQATPSMRIKNFPLRERLVLIPVDIVLALRQVIPLTLIFFFIAGFTGDAPFLQSALSSALPPVIALLTGVMAGSVLTPLLLPWIPGRAFSIKGGVCGLLLFFPVFSAFQGDASHSAIENIAWLLITLAVSSWFGMAFTGATTYTSLNGVRKEMLRAMPLQFLFMVTGIALWATALWIS